MKSLNNLSTPVEPFNKENQHVFILLIFCFFVLFSSNIKAADFVGSEACIDCHKDTYNAWQGSHHQLAMAHASDETVLADFDNAVFPFNGNDNRFFRKDDEFWVNIEGPDGAFHDYQIKYTFGVSPLQQYMVEFADGRIQLIPFAWDSRDKADGGQRWYHLYPNMTKTDEFYWTNSGQNWNFMCADCHSTDLKKNYDGETDQYKTTWSEISVGCEACHGPASEHLNWTKTPSNAEIKNSQTRGFDRDLAKAVKEWVFVDGQKTRQPAKIEHTQQLQVCAQCHSRRTQLTESNDHVKGKLLDRYLHSTITEALYQHDGQIYDENYVYGSFMQSKMAEKGVSCTNCHDPHSAKLKVPEQAVCFQCHAPEAYSPEKHTFHQADSTASQCTTCHMPETTYMQIDPRRDHSWQIPRPDLSKNIGTPNVCNDCHKGTTNDWADKTLAKWFPESKYRNQQHFGVAFYAESINYPNVSKTLSYVAQDHNQADIIRASALQRLNRHVGQNTLVALARATKNENEMIRLGAVQGSGRLPFNERWQLLERLLNDPVYAVRTEAAGALVTYWQQMSAKQKAAIEPALAEYIDIQTFNSDRGFGRTNLGNVYRAKGESEAAINAYKAAIRIEPYFESSYVNLADLYRKLGKEKQAFETLMQGIEGQPKSAPIHYASGLSLLRQKDKKTALSYFQKAVQYAPNNAQYWYVYGLSLETFDLKQASNSLNEAFNLSNNPEHLYARCDMLLRNNGENAAECIEQLKPYLPPQMYSEMKARIR